MSDRLAVMHDGRIEQLGPPKLVYEQPDSTFVASFLGISNLLSGMATGRDGDRCVVQVGAFELIAGAGNVGAQGDTKVIIRPERVRVESHDATGENRIPGLVERVVYRGSADQVFVRLPSGEQLQALVQSAGGQGHEPGEAVRLHLPADALRVLADTGVPPATAEGEKARAIRLAPVGQTEEERSHATGEPT